MIGPGVLPCYLKFKALVIISVVFIFWYLQLSRVAEIVDFTSKDGYNLGCLCPEQEHQWQKSRQLAFFIPSARKPGQKS